jgi:serine/threonine protein kinase
MPRTVGKYDVLEVVGSGGMGTVYRAFDRILERVVALKIVRLELDLPASEVSSRFRNEARAVAQLHHPAIVTIFDYDDQDPGGAYIAMEFVDGCALNQYVTRRPELHLEDAMSAMQQVLSGLVYAHGRGVIHRDIKPANLLVTNDGAVKITDFGIAKINTRSQTQTGAIMGTPQYMAPEQFKGEGIDQRCDVYAAGVVLHTLLTGSPPFQGTPAEVMYQVCSDPPRRVSDAAPTVPRGFDAIVAKALEKKPDDRYSSAAEFREALLACWSAVSRKPAGQMLSETARSVVTSITHRSSLPPMGGAAAQTPKSGGAGSASLPSISGDQSLAAWSREHLAEVERQLTSIVGPMARVLVRQAAATTASKQELYTTLAGQLKSADERRRFLKLGGHVQPSTPAPPTPDDSAQSGMLASLARRPLTPEATTRASQLLARYIGPIAAVLTRNLAQKATDEAHLYALLAERVSEGKERERFMREASRPR